MKAGQKWLPPPSLRQRLKRPDFRLKKRPARGDAP
jgi:hypothetical protein